jgi:hypothetical protein
VDKERADGRDNFARLSRQQRQRDPTSGGYGGVLKDRESCLGSEGEGVPKQRERDVEGSSEGDGAGRDSLSYQNSATSYIC